MAHKANQDHIASNSRSQASHEREASLRALPSVDALGREIARQLHGQPRQAMYAARRVAQAARAEIAATRAAIQAGALVPAIEQLALLAIQRLESSAAPNLREVINATGVIIHTNLGRAPLSEAAIQHMAEVARGYSNLEYDLATGGRGSRQAPVRTLLRELTGAQDALVVNNNAAAVLVVLTALAQNREVVVSRGELVEIGGGFRIPEVLAQSGARLVEVGTTNRTYAADFARAVSGETAALLAVHPSNFQVVGYTQAPMIADLAQVAHSHHLPLIHDVGSGALALTDEWSLAHEPTPQESLAAGADIVCFSADKLLGGPQAGVIVGTTSLIAEIERHPLMRAIRSDKLTLAALEVTLQQHKDGLAQRDIPIWRMIATSSDELQRRAERWVAHFSTHGLAAQVTPIASAIGGGALPGQTLPGFACAIIQDVAEDVATPDRALHINVARLAERLRSMRPPVIARILHDQLLLDPRTVAPHQDGQLMQSVIDAARVL